MIWYYILKDVKWINVVHNDEHNKFMNIKDGLHTFNLDSNETDVYILLEAHPWITALDLSYKSTINRSTLYRILERLIKKGLVEVKLDDNTTLYATTGEDGFKQLLREETVQLNQKKEALLTLGSLFKAVNDKQFQTSVKFHRGIRGVRNLEWKRCVESIEHLYIGSGVWYDHIGQDFAAEIREEIVKRKIVVREIINTERFVPIDLNGYTKEFDNTMYALENFSHRYVDTSFVNAKQEIAIIGNAVHLQSYERDDVVGIEIISPSYAKTMKDMFKLLWNHAKVGDHRGGEDYSLTIISPTTAI